METPRGDLLNKEELNEVFPPLALPLADLKIKTLEGVLYIFDSLRKKWLKLTPEEWVRQHFVYYLCHYRGYPQHAFANETTLPHSQRRGRTDTVIYGSQGKPWAIVEYKAAQLPLKAEMWSQLIAYNLYYQADLLCLTNGLKQIICLLGEKNDEHRFLLEMPRYSELKTHYTTQ